MNGLFVSEEEKQRISLFSARIHHKRRKVHLKGKARKSVLVSSRKSTLKKQSPESYLPSQNESWKHWKIHSERKYDLEKKKEKEVPHYKSGICT